MVEESILKGYVSGTSSATFLALIPKCDKPESLSNFRSIALCNLVYKIISKINKNRIKPMLSKFVSKEKIRLLENRQIMDAIGVV